MLDLECAPLASAMRPRVDPQHHGGERTAAGVVVPTSTAERTYERTGGKHIQAERSLELNSTDAEAVRLPTTSFARRA